MWKCSWIIQNPEKCLCKRRQGKSPPTRFTKKQRKTDKHTKREREGEMHESAVCQKTGVERHKKSSEDLALTGVLTKRSLYCGCFVYAYLYCLCCGDLSVLHGHILETSLHTGTNSFDFRMNFWFQLWYNETKSSNSMVGLQMSVTQCLWGKSIKHRQIFPSIFLLKYFFLQAWSKL